jgi:hypothetical protein
MLFQEKEYDKGSVQRQGQAGNRFYPGKVGFPVIDELIDIAEGNRQIDKGNQDPEGDSAPGKQFRKPFCHVDSPVFPDKRFDENI